MAELADLRVRFDAFLASAATEAGSRPMRYALLAPALIAMVMFGITPWVLIFWPAYVAVDLTLGWHVDRVAKFGIASLSTLRKLQMHHAATLITFSSLPIMLSTRPDPMMQWTAIPFLAAQMMNCLGIDAQSRDRVVVSVAGLALVMQAIVWGIASASGMARWEQGYLHVCAGFVAAFFAHVCFTSVGVRMKLEERTQLLVRAQHGEAVGRLTSGVAHDFNNLLTVMRGNLDLLDEVSPEERRPLLAEIAAAADRGGDLVGQLLGRPRETGSKRREVDLSRFLDSFATFARRVLPANVRMTLHTEPGLVLRTDPVRLEASLLNLVVNARDAMPDGGTIALDARADPAASDRLCIEVGDDGPGMSPELVAHATEAFVTTKPPGEGTGLGLAMVRDFVEGERGSLEIDSRPGRGTRVRLRLPR